MPRARPAGAPTPAGVACPGAARSAHTWEARGARSDPSSGLLLAVQMVEMYSGSLPWESGPSLTLARW